MEVVQVHRNGEMQLFHIAQLWLAYRQLLALRKRKRRSPAVWVTNYLTKRKRFGLASGLLPLLREDHFGHMNMFKKILGMDQGMFDYICDKLAPLIERSVNNYRKDVITVRERVSITLYFNPRPNRPKFKPYIENDSQTPKNQKFPAVMFLSFDPKDRLKFNFEVYIKFGAVNS